MLSSLAELQSQDKWREWVAHTFMTKKEQILAGQYTMQALATDAGAFDQALGATEGKSRNSGGAFFVPDVKPKGNCFNCGKPGHYAKDCKNRKREKKGEAKDKKTTVTKMTMTKTKKGGKAKEKTRTKARANARTGIGVLLTSSSSPSAMRRSRRKKTL